MNSIYNFFTGSNVSYFRLAYGIPILMAILTTHFTFTIIQNNYLKFYRPLYILFLSAALLIFSKIAIDDLEVDDY